LYLYEVYNDCVSVFKRLLLGENSSRISNQDNKFLEKNIKKRMSLIIEAWEVSKNVVSFGSRAHTFHEYLQAHLNNEEGLYIVVFFPFGIKVSNMTELKRREEGLPSSSRIKYLNVCGKKISRIWITLSKHATKP
jgi:hypothetical protein